MSTTFNYSQAFARNIGWVTQEEQEILRKKTVAIAGMGGVGGIHLLTLVRLGISNFRIADFDVFDIANLNRQAGASISTIGRFKSTTLAKMAYDINPEINIVIFENGLEPANLNAFLNGVDLYVDGLDFFAFSIRQATFAKCAELLIPAVTVAPLGMGAGLLNFIPGCMTFENYFQMGDLPEQEKALLFLIGLAPSGLHGSYLVDPTTVDFMAKRGPSTVIACQLCAGVAATEALKILLRRGRVRAAPHGVHFDAYRNKLVHTWRPGGNKNPIQRLAMRILHQRMMKESANS